MTDLFWGYVRQAMTAAGVALMVTYFNMDENTAITFVTPIVVFIIGLVMTGGSAGWLTLVKANTMAVPLKTGERSDVPTVSAATGAVTPATRR